MIGAKAFFDLGVPRARDGQLVAREEIGEVQPSDGKEPPPGLESFVCESCREMTAEPFGRGRGDRKVCLPCRGSPRDGT